jgi:Uma2 family endonuclease
MATRTLITSDQYDALPEKEGVKYELNEGELVTVSPSPRLVHNRVRDEIGFRLREFVRSRKLGEVTMETDFKLTEGTIRIPDIAFVSADRLAGIDPRQRLEGAPDLAVEVASPSDDPDDLVLKAQQYIATGSKAVWVIYPEARLAYLYKPGERPEIRDAGHSLDDAELLPGFSAPLSDILSN